MEKMLVTEMLVPPKFIQNLFKLKAMKSVSL